ncbi:MAG: NAD(P)H-dependent oxidoreductase subunit E [Nitrospirae bacterium]|nr:NAD(P)H-dependent oxidoreductase subunit E [Nitrospirota bacterium]
MTENGLKILVVDDESIVIRSCEIVLKGAGYHMEGALGGREAILKMEKERYDLVFTDLKMPEVDGITLIRWLRNSRPDTGIVILTGYPSQDTIKEALGLGIIDYVPKPFTPAVLLDVTRRAVQWLETRKPGAFAISAEMSSPAEPVRDDFPPAMAAELDKVIAHYKHIPGSLIPVLQRAQEMIGWLPVAALKRVSKGMNIPAAEVHSVVSFYSFFTMKPRGDHNIRVCLGTACYVKRAEEILRNLKEGLGIGVGEVTPDRKFSLEEVRCLGACGLAPVVVVDHDTFGGIDPKNSMEIVEKYR